MVYADEIAKHLQVPLQGTNIALDGVSSVFNPKPQTLMFISKYADDWIEKLNQLEDVMVLALPDYANQLSVTHVLVENPRLAFAMASHLFAPPPKPHIAKTAVIAESATIGENVTIGEYCVIGENVVIGDGTRLRHHVVIYDNCEIGESTVIKSNTVIGERGFGVDFMEDGTPIPLAHFGRVRIGNHVEIGASCTIARGTLDDTVIEDYVKVDDQVHIAHNCHIGARCILTAGTELSGSVKVGHDVWFGPQSSILNGIEIGNHVFIGIGVTVIRSVEDNGRVTIATRQKKKAKS